MIAHKGASLSKAMVAPVVVERRGVFGIALGVSTSFVFLFVLFGALLDKAGAGGYFIRVAFSLLGHMRGGAGQGRRGVVRHDGPDLGLLDRQRGGPRARSRSPLMKRVGFPAEKAGAVEVASSTNGQLTPPIMGAAAFSWWNTWAFPTSTSSSTPFLPAIISYIALVYIVHLEAAKADMRGLPRRYESTLAGTLLAFVMTVIGLIVLSGAVYYGMGWVKTAFGAGVAVDRGRF